MVAKAVDSLRLRVETREGSIHCSFAASTFTVSADPIHLANIFHNLLDNADKYSPDRPDIVVETWNAGQSIVIRFADKGIGIGKDELKKVFEKYYRVATGNVHNVKGFGLGLSYVKLMLDAHGATVGIVSEPGKGTAISISFPLIPEGTQTV